MVRTLPSHFLLCFLPDSRLNFLTLDHATQVGTHADSLIAEAAIKGITGWDQELAWEAVWKGATVPPKDDWDVRYADREEVRFCSIPFFTCYYPSAMLHLGRR